MQNLITFQQTRGGYGCDQGVWRGGDSGVQLNRQVGMVMASDCYWSAGVTCGKLDSLGWLISKAHVPFK